MFEFYENEEFQVRIPLCLNKELNLTIFPHKVKLTRFEIGPVWQLLLLHRKKNMFL